MAKKQGSAKKAARAVGKVAAKKPVVHKKAVTQKVAQKATAKKSTAKRLPQQVVASSPKKLSQTHLSWLDAEARTPIIDLYAQQLDSFIATIADGKVDEHEVESQEARLVQLMREIEPQLDDVMHEKVTRLLCELTAYDIMQVLHTMQQAQPHGAFQG
ncbi:MAG: hypothetical protein EXR78_02200 [Deltaproteobacteria bacterium]|nr:hypothetical protein [Deltaproteobacteria bacterium]